MGATDIYIRRPNRTDFSEDNIEVSDLLEQFLQQIEMVLGTPKTTVLGRPDFGVGLGTYLWEFNVGESDLKQAISEQITRNCSLSGEFSYTIDVQFYKVNNQDAAIVDILVQNDNLVRIVASAN